MTRKLEIGPRRAGPIDDTWECMDIQKRHFFKLTDWIHDLQKPPCPIEDDTYDLIYMSHVLEHVDWRLTAPVLLDIYRIIKPGGVLEVWVPSLDVILNDYIYQATSKPDWGWHDNPEKSICKWFSSRVFGWGRKGKDFHKAAFDRAYLTECLTAAGFVDVDPLDKPRNTRRGRGNLGMKGVK